MTGVKLSIDFAAALAKLAPGQMQGTWQLPAELARLVIAAGAQEVELEIRPTRLELAAPGARLDLLAVRDLEILLDAAAPADRRHRALMSLDERGALALAALATLSWTRLYLASGGTQGWALAAKAGGRPRLGRAPATPGAVVVIRGLRLDAAAAKRWLQRNGRFAPVPITLAGRPIFRGFRRPLIRRRLHQPLPAVLAIGERGEAPRLWLLEHGIVSTRATVPGYPAFEAAVELASLVRPGATPATLREVIQPHLEPLIRSAVDLIGEFARSTGGAAAGDRTVRLLLEAARRPRFRSRLSTIPAFPSIAASGVRGRLSIADLELLSRADDGGRRPLESLPAGQDPRRFVLGRRPALILGQGERTLLGEILDVDFVTPPERPRPRRSLRRLSAAGGGYAAYVWKRLRRTLVSETALSPGERSFLEAVRRTADGGGPRTITFCTGGGRIHLTGAGRLLLPRDNPTVAAAVRAITRDPGWLYPALVALLGGHDLPAARLRESWSAVEMIGSR